MKKILIVVSIYRVGERMYPTIVKLSEQYDVDILKVAQMGNSFEWYGDNDFRLLFDRKYEKCVNNIFYTPPILDEYDLLLFDDDRPRNGLKELYQEAKKLGILTIGNRHGNVDFKEKEFRDHLIICWDKLFLFGDKGYNIHLRSGVGSNENFLIGGIPSNDNLKKYERTDKHILIIVNFLGNRTAPFKRFDKETFDKLGLVELQNEFNKKVVIKLKSRQDHPFPKRDFEYVEKILPNNLDYEIVMDVDDDNKLISDSFIVFSAPSVMAFKPIQKGIPTILLNGYGQTGLFYDYMGLVDLDTQIIFDEVQRQYTNGKEKEFVLNTIKGGIDFSSTEKYVNVIRGLMA